MAAARHHRRAFIASALIAFTIPGQAEPRYESYENESLVRAPVISSRPIYQTVNAPHTECWTETVSDGPQSREGSGGAVLGAIAGGLLGSAVGRGDGRVAAAAVGAATGAVVGDRMENRSDVPRQIERCQTTEQQRRVLSGYDVLYRYQGRDFRARLPYDPGDSVKLRVRVSIAEDQRGEGGESGGWGDQ